MASASGTTVARRERGKETSKIITTVAGRAAGQHLELVDLGPADGAEMVGVLARGMRDNPLHVAAYGPDPARRERIHGRVMAADSAAWPRQQPFGQRRDGVLVAAATWRPTSRRTSPSTVGLTTRSSGRQTSSACPTGSCAAPRPRRDPPREAGRAERVYPSRDQPA